MTEKTEAQLAAEKKADEAKAKPAAKPKTAAKPKPATKPKTAADAGKKTPAKADGFTVICHVEAGRRRGGKRWPKGETSVPVKEMTEKLAAALDADPLLTVIAP